MSSKKVKVSTIIIITLILSLITLVALLSRQPNQNLYERHRAFLSHSLGYYEMIREYSFEKQTPRSPFEGGGTVTRNAWVLGFTRHNGTEMSFFFTDEYSLYRSVSFLAEQIARSHLIDEIASNYFERDSFGGTFEDHPTTRVFLSFTAPTNHYTQHLLCQKNGLQLSSITPQELVACWGFALRVYITTPNYESHIGTIEQMEAMTRALSAYLEQGQVEVRFTLYDMWITNHDISFRGYYDSQMDSFETVSYRQWWEEHRSAN